MLRQRRALETHAEEGNVGLLFVGDIDRAGNLLHDALHAGRQPAQFAEIRAEDFHRDVGTAAGEHVVDAVRDRLADDDLAAGDAGKIGAQRGEEVLLAALAHLQRDFHFRRRYVHRVRITFGAASAARGGDHLGMRQQDVLHHAPETVGFRQRSARQRRHADGQRAFVEVGQECAAGEAQRNQCGNQRGNADSCHRLPTRHRYVQRAPVADFECVDKARLDALAHRLRVGQHECRQHRRHSDRNRQRGGQ